MRRRKSKDYFEGIPIIELGCGPVQVPVNRAFMNSRAALDDFARACIRIQKVKTVVTIRVVHHLGSIDFSSPPLLRSDPAVH